MCLDFSNLSATNFVTVSGINFTGSSSNGTISLDGTMGDVAVHLTNLTINASSGRGLFWERVYGLADHITSVNSGSGCQAFTFQGSPDGNQAMTQPWNTPLSLGTINAMYVEDSMVNWTCANDTIIDSYGGSRWVFRHNTATFNSANNSSDVIGGGHGTDSGDRWGGPISWEIYQNVFTNQNAQSTRANTFRGGTGVIFSNVYNGAIGGPEITIYRACPALLVGWPLCDGSNITVGSGAPARFWAGTVNSTINGANCLTSGASSNCGFCSLNKERRCGSNTECSSVGQGTCSLYFDNPGMCRNQPGVAPGQIFDGIYAWSNGSGHDISTGTGNNPSCAAAENSFMQAGVAYVNNGTTPKPGYTAFTYPHPLQGGGGTPIASISPSSINFGSVTVGQTSPPTLVTISNTGTATMNVSGLTIQSLGFAADFIMSGGTCGAAPFSITAGNSCTVNLSFKPSTSNVSETGQFIVSANTSPAQTSINIQGIGQPPTSPPQTLVATAH